MPLGVKLDLQTVVQALPDQEVELYFTNGSTTLASGAALVFRNGAAVAAPADGIVLIVRDPSNAKGVEKSRNFQDGRSDVPGGGSQPRTSTQWIVTISDRFSLALKRA